MNVSNLESKYDITVLAIRNRGSKAWGISGSNSDLDYSVIFSQDPQDHYTLGEYKDSFKEEGRQDLMMHDVKKFSTLLLKNNPTGIEFLESESHEYYYSPEVRELFSKLKNYVRSNFDYYVVSNSYRGIAESDYKDYKKKNLSQREKVKKNIFILRSCLYSEHFLQEKTMPNFNFPEFLKKTSLLSEQEKTEGQQLINLKVNENYNNYPGLILKGKINDILDKGFSGKSRGTSISEERLNQFIKNIFDIVY